MESQEMRGGNIMATKEGVIIKAFWTRYSLVYGQIMGDSVREKYDGKELEGVPITEWWLEHLGFERSRVIEGDWVLEDKVGNCKVALKGNPHGGFHLYSFGEESTEGVGLRGSKKLEFIHQMQNVWWGVTEKEFKLKETWGAKK